MDCTRCGRKACRTAAACGAEAFDRGDVRDTYHCEETAPVVEAAARLVDHGHTSHKGLESA